jgi:hypothetical protein
MGKEGESTLSVFIASLEGEKRRILVCSGDSSD